MDEGGEICRSHYFPLEINIDGEGVKELVKTIKKFHHSQRLHNLAI